MGAWQDFIIDLLKRIFDDKFYDFLKENLYYIKPYAFDCITTIRNTAKWSRQDESEANRIANEDLRKIYTSYKQIRGMKLAIQVYENSLAKQTENVPDDTYLTTQYQTDDEELNSYIGRPIGIAEYSEEILNLMSLEEIEKLPQDVREQIHIDGMSR